MPYADAEQHRDRGAIVISQATTRYHVSAILAKLGAANRAKAAAPAVKHNLAA